MKKIVWFTGQPGSGKTTLSHALQKKLKNIHPEISVMSIDGDDLRDIFVNKDYSFFTTENFNDSLFFYPEKGLDRIDLTIESTIDLIKIMHEPYDSIRRNIYDVIPVVPSYDQELTVVMFPFTETRYKKDGTVERYRFNERHYIRGGNVYGVRKWSQEE